MTEQLRYYQREMLDRLHDAWKKYQSVMVQMPTGTGKTFLVAEEIKNEESRARKAGSNGVLVVTHRIELIHQISKTLDSFHIGHGLIVSGLPIDKSKWVQVASIQTLTKRTDNMALNPSLVIIDEAHHALAKTYRMLWDLWPKAKFLGLTATPCRLNSKGFTDLFDVLLQSWTIQKFIDKGWLSDFEYVSASPESLMIHQVASLNKRGADGDYQNKEMATVMDCPESVAHLYKTYQAFANKKKGIIYAINREHAQHIAAYYQQHGVSCCVIDSKTPANTRSQLLADYMEGRLSVMVNVDIFGEGFDCPEVEFIQLARPTLSLSKYLQQVGRGMRISAGKEAVLILDNVGLYQTFGLPTEERDWQLTFSGKAPGKGQQGMARPVILKDDEMAEKELVNLEMVRICKSSESLKGLAVCLQDGKYGIMKDGKITCQPMFERIRKIADGRLFALATYPYLSHHNKSTVIDCQGYDMRADLYGNVTQKGDYFYASNSSGERVIWDSVGMAYYKNVPDFERLGAIEIQKDTTGMYTLRYTRGLQNFKFSKQEIRYNSHIAIIRDQLIVRNNGSYRVFRIFGYMHGRILACARNQYESFEVFWDGSIGRHYEQVPNGAFFQLHDANELKLKYAD